MTNGQLDAMDVLSIASFLIGYENLIENREQSRENDVSAANDKQAKYLLDEIGKRLDKQDEALDRLAEMLAERRTDGD
jgi:hypothetical protein